MRSKTGKAKIEYDSGEVYEGLIKDGEPHGSGKMTWPDGSLYEGAWTEGKMNGQGKHKLANGDEYSGMVKDDNYDGVGTFKYSCGGVYEGDYVNGEMEGNGKLSLANGDVIYEGQWKDGKMHGEGTFTFPDGDVYKGQYQDDWKHGEGTYTWADGRVYKGQFEDDNMHGEGIYTYANGDTFNGVVWNISKKHGSGVLKKANGDRFEQVWEDDKLVSNKQIATRIIHSQSEHLNENEVAHTVVLNDEHRKCVVCFNEFATDTGSYDENIKKRLPVLSKECDHWYCHGCVLNAQAEKVESNGGEVPEWIPCLGSCTTDDAFCPSKPNYHRLLISLLGDSIPVVQKSA